MFLLSFSGLEVESDCRPLSCTVDAKERRAEFPFRRSEVRQNASLKSANRRGSERPPFDGEAESCARVALCHRPLDRVGDSFLRVNVTAMNTGRILAVDDDEVVITNGCMEAINLALRTVAALVRGAALA